MEIILKQRMIYLIGICKLYILPYTVIPASIRVQHNFINMISPSQGRSDVARWIVGRNLILADAAFSITGNCR